MLSKMTSLSTQLRNLQLPDTFSVLNLQDKRASILFDAHEAADIDIDTVFSLGRSGLDELQQIDSDLAKFEKTLFSENVKTIERTQQPKEFNQRLDKKIKEFLVYLSPYFLIKPAQKTLEWLIRRFRIHVFNVDALMSCILPFHETNLFARVMNIITLNKQTARWGWLEEVKKTGVPLPKSILIQQCLSDSSVLMFVCEMLPQAIEIRQNKASEKLKTLCAFYTSVLLGVAETPENLSESRIGRILPCLYQGLKSVVTDYKASSYMILSEICLKKTFKDQIINSLVEQISKSLIGSTIALGILALECIYRSQKSKQISTKALKLICESPDTMKQIKDLSNNGALVSFLPVFLSSVLSNSLISTQNDETDVQKHSNYEDISTEFLQNMNLEPTSVKYLLRKLLEQYLKLKEVSIQKASLLQIGQKYLQVFEKRYPTETDSVLQEFMSKCKDMSDTAWLQDLISAGQNLVKFKVLPGTDTSLLLSLNHPDPSRRKLAVHELIQIISSEDEEMKLNSFAKSSLLLRMNDDDDSVVEEVFKAGPLLVQMVGEDAVIEAFLKKMKSTKPNHRLALVENLFKIFTQDIKVSKDFNLKSINLISGVIGTLLPWKSSIKDQVRVWKLLKDSSLTSSNPFLMGIYQAVKDIDWNYFEGASSMNDAILQLLLQILTATSEVLLDDSFINLSLDFALLKSSDHLFKSYFCGVLFHLVDKMETDGFLSLVHKMELFLCENIASLTSFEGKEKYVKPVLKSSTPNECIELAMSSIALKKRELPKEKEKYQTPNLFCLLLRKIVEKLPNSDDGDSKQPSSDTTSRVFEMLASASGRENQRHPYVTVFRSFLQQFLKKQFPTPKALLNFLSRMFMEPPALDWLSDDGNAFLKVDVYVCALHIFKVCLETFNSDVQSLISFDSEVVPTLLLLLYHPLKVVRSASIGCIQAFHDNNIAKIDKGLKYLLDYLVDNDTELVEDRHQICIVLERMFKPLSNVSQDVEMLEPRHLEDLRFLMKYLSGFILRSNLRMKQGMAKLTSSINLQEYLVYTIPVIEDLIRNAQTSGLSALQFQLLKLLIGKFVPTNTDIFEKFPSSLTIFKTGLGLGKTINGLDSSIQQECLKQVTIKFHDSISSRKAKSEIFDTLLEGIVNSNNSNVIKIIKQKLIELPISSEDIATQLTSLTECEASQPKKARKMRRATKSSAHHDRLDLVDTPKWSKTVLLLEVIQLKENLLFNERLVLSIFDLLVMCLEMNATNQPSIEYMKQLLLSSLRKSIDQILNSSPKDVISQEKFSIEKVIECFRTSENPQTHHQALLLLGRAAILFPDLVLHNIMSIFTFMGSNVLRQDDSYSYDVIKRTIDAVIPTLVSAGTTSVAEPDQIGPNADDIVKLVVRVFVDAVPYIPDHRRLLLFEHFATVLVADKNLYVIIAMLLEKLMVQTDFGKGSDQKIGDGSLLSSDFPSLLIKHFSLEDQLTTITNLVAFIHKIPDEKQEENKAKRVNTRSIKVSNNEEDLVPLFDTANYETQDIHRYKLHILDFVSRVLRDQDFIEKALSEDGNSMENLYLRLLQEIMLCIVGQKSDGDQKTSYTKYMKIKHQKSGEIINGVYKLLTFDTFINVTSKLMKNENATMRKKVMEIIGQKTKSTDQLDENEILRLLSLARMLVDAVKSSSVEVPGNKMIALQTLRPLFAVLSKEHAEDVTEMVDVFIEIISCDEMHSHILSNALLCIGELALCLKAHMIQFLPRLMPSIIKLLADENREKDIAILSALTTLQKVIGSLSKFMSPYIVEILQVLTCHRFNADITGKASSCDSQIKIKALSLSETISKNIIPRVLLPMLDSAFDYVVQSEKHSLVALMEILHQAVESMPRDVIKSNHVKLLTLFMKAFDVRSLHSDRPEQQVENAERKIITAFCALVMKMSENTFRPMFLKIFTWSTASEEKSTRLITFYHLCGAIAEKLKGLFLLFAGHIIKPCAELIGRCHMKNEDCTLFKEDAEVKTNSLLIYMFDCLQKCFLHDSQKFLNKERFEYLLSPLVDQLDNGLGGISVYNERVLNHLNPCLVYFAVAVNDESCWKMLNYQILLKTRNQTSQVRLAALKLLEQIHKHIGESYLILLPETIPFLAELMEDESFEVEKQCQQVISHMEEILGESLQKYF